MEGETTKTPYNTIYASLNNKKQDGEVLCCVHGSNCIYGNGKQDGKSDENQYINLGSPKKEEKVAKKLTEKLNSLVEQETSSKPELMSLHSFMTKNEKPKKVKSEKRKKKTPVLVDDSQSYILLGPSSDDQSSQSAPQAPQTLLTSPTVAEMPVGNQIDEYPKGGEAASAYIGVQTLSDAEGRLTNRGEFALYHLFTPNSHLDTLTEKLPLMIVYRTTTKKNRHYSIRQTADQHYFVDCGYPNVRKHYSLNQLVMFYKFSATCEINPDDTSADSFSWWLE
ncbi:unnamed protein product [Caenorhabditis brenneri]